MGLGTIIASVIGGSAVAITLISVPFVAPAFRRVCIPYVPASTRQISNVKKLLEHCSRPIAPIVDLGSGDGRIVRLLTLLI